MSAHDLDLVKNLVTLDALWAGAEQLGRVEVDNEFGPSRTYRARIKCETPNGSIIWATGRDTNVRLALRAAIEEALKLSVQPR